MDVDITRFAAARPADFTPRALPLRHLEPPRNAEVHVWHLDLGLLSASLQAALDSQSVEEHRLQMTPGQLRFARRFYLRLLLGAYLDMPGKAIKLVRNPRGKPVLDASAHDATLHFSMAKSGEQVLIGFASGVHLGVDLEPAGRRAHNPLGVARRYFSPEESAALAALAPSLVNEAFVRAWACKEAVVKASGQGIANEFGRFSVETDLARPVAVVASENEPPEQWTLSLLQPQDGFLGAVACPGRGLGVRARQLLPLRQPASR